MANNFTRPASGAGAWHQSFDFDAWYRIAAALEVELGRRAFVYIDGHGENAYGAGYDYHRRACVIHRARQAQQLAVDGYRPPPPRQMELAL